MDRCTSKLHTVATLAEGRGCTSSLHVQRFAMDISSDAGTEFLRAFFVFSIPVRRGQLEQRITADATWSPATYAEWPEVARTFQESRDYTHQGARTAPVVQPPSAMPDASQPASVAWQHWETLADALPLLSVQASPRGESTEQQEARLQLPALDPRAEVTVSNGSVVFNACWGSMRGLTSRQATAERQAELTEFLFVLYCIAEGVDECLGCKFAPAQRFLRRRMEYSPYSRLNGYGATRVYRGGGTWLRVFERV